MLYVRTYAGLREFFETIIMRGWRMAGRQTWQAGFTYSLPYVRSLAR